MSIRFIQGELLIRRGRTFRHLPPLKEEASLDVGDEVVEVLGKSYGLGHHSVSFEDGLVATLLLLTEEAHYLLPEKFYTWQIKKRRPFD